MKILHVIIYESIEKNSHLDIENYIFDINNIKHIELNSYYSHIHLGIKKRLLINTISFDLEGYCDKEFNLDKLNEYLTNSEDSKIFKIELMK